MSNKAPKVTFIIPARNEGKMIRECLDSLLSIDYPKDKVEIILAEGKSTDNTREVIEKYASRHSNIRVFDNPTGNTATGRNICLKHSNGDFIMNYSGHAVAEKDILKVLLSKFTYGIGGVGYSNVAPEQNAVGNAIAVAFRGFMAGSGTDTFVQNAVFENERLVDHMPFVCYKREVFDKVGCFDEDLPSGQDVDFNLRLKEEGYKIWYTPDTRILLYRSDSMRKLLKKMIRYGVARAWLMQKHPGSVSIFHVAPPAIAVVVPVILALTFLGIFPLPLFVLGCVAYGGACIASSLKVSKRIGYALLNLLVYPIIHFGYGIGILMGFLKRRRND